MSPSRWLTRRLLLLFSLLAFLATGVHLTAQYGRAQTAEAMLVASEAGRQQTLSQQATKALLRAALTRGAEREQSLSEARTALGRLSQAHALLTSAASDPLSGSASPEVQAHLSETAAALDVLMGSGETLGTHLAVGGTNAPQRLVAGVQVGERAFLLAMDTLTRHHQAEAQRSAAALATAQHVLYGLIVLTLLALLVFAMRPAARQIEHLAAEAKRRRRLLAESRTALEETERRLAHARASADAALQARREFLSVVSHEMRTPLNGILGTVEAMQTDRAGDRTEGLDVIRQSGEKMLATVEHVLSYVDAPTMTREVSRIEVRTLIDDVMREAARSREARGLHLSAHIAGGVPLFVSGDAARLRAVLGHLLANAVAFTDEGCVELYVRRYVGEDELHFAVRDTGVGIAPEQIEHIFEPFYQGDGTHARRTDGLGLGLSIARRTVDALGGRISVRSQPGEGTEASFFLPLPALTPPAAERQALRCRRVLIAGAPGPERDRLVDRVRDWGVHALCVATASAARAALEPDADFDAFLIATPLSDHVPGDALARDLHDRLPEVPALLLGGARAGGLPPRTVALPHPFGDEALYQTLANAVADSALRILQPVRAGLAAPMHVAPGTVRVLVAEDHAVQRSVIVRTLEGLGAAVHAVNNGLEAVEAFEASTFDIAFLDIQMPVMDGFTAAQLIRRESGSVRLVALTGQTTHTRRSAFTDAGFDALLYKPLRRDAAARLLEQASAPSGAEANPVARATLIVR
jgi:signal transduction histidine kinase/ActR/RegA family two-component response regulator